MTTKPRKAQKSRVVGRRRQAPKATLSVPAALDTSPGKVGRSECASKAKQCLPAVPAPLSVEGHPHGADKARLVLPPADISLTIAQIRAAHRERCFAMEQRKRLDLALGSFLRMALGWSRALPKEEAERISKEAQRLMGKPEGDWRHVVEASGLARGPFEDIEKKAKRTMEELGETLPAWAAFGEDVRGFGTCSLAVIVAEAGDLSGYATPSKLWKRMGVAVMGTVRQGGLPSNASKEAWIAHGYNRQRRSRMWNIGDALIKGNRDGKYRTLYLQRKEYELARDPEMKPIKAHRRAQRYMEKRLLRDLWQAWRRAGTLAQPDVGLPAATLSAQAERPARRRLAAKFQVPGAIHSGHVPEPPAKVDVSSAMSLPAALILEAAE